jgi:sugar/nucleoside kinase (ribokinase family)
VAGRVAEVGEVSTNEDPPARYNRTVAHPRRLVFVGEVVIDVTTWVPALPVAGGDVLATAAALTPGGGFNVMAAAARQGVPVVFAGRHGTGVAGATVRAALAAEGVEIAGAADPGADTGFVVTMVGPDGERTFVTTPEALSGLDAGGRAAVPAVSGDLVYVSGYGLLAESGDELARWVSNLDAAISVVVDPGTLADQLPRPALDVLLARADWWSCNRREAEQITGVADPARAGAVLAERRATGGVVVRDGAAGCVLVVRGPQPEAGRWIAAPVVDVIDTTGAGDAHVGVFVAGLAQGRDPFEAARRATVAAALSVTRRGPATAPGAEEVDRVLEAWSSRPGRNPLTGPTS